MSTTTDRAHFLSYLHSIQRKAKSVTDFFSRELLDFRTLHSDFELVLVSLGLILLLPYFANNHIFDLLDEINFIINHQEADFMILLSRGSETILILSAIVILLNYYFSKEEATAEATVKHIGEPHSCLTISKVPAHLVYKEVKPVDESAAIYHSGFQGTGSSENEFMELNAQTLQLTKDAEAYTQAYKEFFATDLILPQAPVPEGPRYVSLADLLGNEIDDTNSNTTTEPI